MFLLKRPFAFIEKVMSFILCVSFAAPSIHGQACNGSKELCSKPYHTVIQIKTHNSTSTTQKKLFSVFPNPVANQHKDLSQQLQDGIRAFKIPLHMNGDKVWIAHTLSKRQFDETKIPGLYRNIGNKFWKIDATNQSFDEFLQQIKEFLDNNPRDIITLDLNIFVQKDNFDKITKAFQSNGLFDYQYENLGAFGPTLEEMIRQNKRLVVFVDDPILPKEKFTSVQLVHGNDTFKTLDALKKDESISKMQKGYPLNELSQHITPVIAGDENLARKANSYAVLKKHLQQFYTEVGVYPTFISVDFYDENFADIKKIVNELNSGKILK